MDAIDIMLLTGEWMLRVLFLILIARPVARVFKYRLLIKYRRQLGQLFGLLTALHLAAYLFFYIDTWAFLLTLFDDLWFITGLIATIISFALTLTSNNWSIKKLKPKNWRYLHMTTYIVGPIGILHGEIASKQTNFELYFMLSAYALLLLWRFRTVWMTGLTMVALMISLFTISPDATQTTPTTTEVVQELPLAHERCGQYGLDYHEEPNGFYNCLRKDR